MKTIFKYGIFLAFAVSSFNFPAKAQDNPENFKPSTFISATAHYGFIMPSRHTMNHLIKGHINSFELGWNYQTRGHKPWHQLHNFPTWGFSYYFSELSNPKQLGYVNGFFTHVGFTYLKTNKLRLENRIGAGLAILTKSFQRVDNYKNNAIGSNINSFLQISLGLHHKISDKLSLKYGIALSHYSNGAYQVPNLGLNIVSANITMNLFTKANTKYYKRDSVISSPDKKIKYQFLLASGIKDTYPYGYPKFIAISSTFSARKMINRKSAIGGGIDFFYEPSLKRRFLNSNIVSQNADYFRLGVHFTHEFFITKLSIISNAGIYAYSKWKQDGILYQRIGLNYPLTKHISANVSLKVHFFIADYSELGLIYKF